MTSSVLAAPAAADYFDDKTSYGGGAFFGYRFGERSGFEWGLEAFATYRLSGLGCTTDERTGVGPLAQLGFLGFEEPRLTLGMQGGGELERMALALTAEVGLTYRFGDRPGFGVHMGVLPEFTIVNAGVTYEWLLAQGWVGGGLRIYPTYGMPGSCQVGRPLRTQQAALQLSLALAPATATRPARDAVEPVGLAFARDAQLEAQSVPAFVQLAGELYAAGAPAALVQRALSAAADEQRHARLCARLAERHLSRPIAIHVPALPARPALPRREALLRLAGESWLDGCLNEGSAAAQASAAADRTCDPEARTILGSIAADERRHTELAWSILEWTFRSAGDDARDHVHRITRSAGTAVPADHEQAPPGLAEHGRLDADALTAIADDHAARSRARLFAQEWAERPIMR